MVTLCLSIVLIVMCIKLIDEWNVHGSDAAWERLLSIVIAILLIFSIMATNDAFTFPTDMRVIREQIISRTRTNQN